jgi:HK97 family phage major capsid protein
MLSDTALKLAPEAEGHQNQYLWQPATRPARRDLYGYPYVINQDMAVPATGVKSVLFGDF